MRLASTAIGLAGLGLYCVLVVAGGRSLGVGVTTAVDQPAVSVDEIDPALADALDQAAETSEPAAEPVVTQPAADGVATTTTERTGAVDAPDTGAEMLQAPPSARSVAPDVVVPPSFQEGTFVREAPRAPLSELSLAMPPKPEMPDDWDGTTLFQPVASAAGLIESKGYKVAVAGVVPTSADEHCTSGGTEWTCGVRARTAFRALLRGRAVVCALPPEADRSFIVAKCRVGKQDVGEWLVANGWAKADANGPYAEAGDKAETDRKGMFGAAPSTQ